MRATLDSVVLDEAIDNIENAAADQERTPLPEP